MKTATNEAPHPASSPNPSSQSSRQPPPPTSTMPIYPPLLPPPDFFDLELEAEKLKDMFKVTNSLKNPLFDETGLVNLPIDERGVLILDPESKTRMVDVEVELDCLYEYLDWIGSAKKALRNEESKQWLEGLRKEVDRDMGEVFDEWHAVVDEERRKSGLTDRWTHWAHFKGQERKGEGTDGEWVIMKPVNETERDKTEGKSLSLVGVEGMRNDEGVPPKPAVPLAHRKEPAMKPVGEEKKTGNQEKAMGAVLVGCNGVVEPMDESPVKADESILTALADTAPVPPPATEETSPVAPPIQLVDLLW